VASFSVLLGIGAVGYRLFGRWLAQGHEAQRTRALAADPASGLCSAEIGGASTLPSEYRSCSPPEAKRAVAEGARALAMSDGLGRTAVRGVVWSGGGQLARQAIQLPVSILLARLLVPGDFGLVGMTLVFVTLAQLLADFGLGSAIVQASSVTRTTLVSCFWANVGVGVALASALALASPAIASFYGDERVAPLVAATSLVLVSSGALTVP